MRDSSGAAEPALSGAKGQRGSGACPEQPSEGAVLARLAFVLRRISGMPDYVGYVEHLYRCHPETPVPSEREYYAEYLRNRYGDSPTRCC